MRVLLIQLPVEDFYTTPIRLYPLGLLYAASTLIHLGATVRILDCLSPLKKKQLPIPDDFEYMKRFIDREPLLFRHFYRFGLDPASILQAAREFEPDLIGISSQFTAYYKSVAELAALLKTQSNIPIFLGGNHATVFADEILATTPAVDHVLRGPAEQALPPFIADFQGTMDAASRSMEWRNLLPAHELIEAASYRMGRDPYVSLTASRGCPYTCDFCSVHAMFGRQIRYRPVEAVLSEMMDCARVRKTRIFNFEDDNIAVNSNWFGRLLEMICSASFPGEIELTAMNGIGYTHLDLELLELMRRAGFRQLNLSYVTHDPKLRNGHGRPPEREALEPIVTSARRLGFFITVYLIIGLPEQRYGEIKKTIDFLLDMGVLVGPSVFYIPPGSDLFPRLDLPPGIARNWNLYRSSAFAVETKHLKRDDLVRLFVYTRHRNLENRKAGNRNL